MMMDVEAKTLLELVQSARDFEVLISAMRTLSEKQVWLIRNSDMDTLVAAALIAQRVNGVRF